MAMSKEKQYLTAIEEKLTELANSTFQTDENGLELLQQLHELIEEAIVFEAECRQEYSIGARFSLIANQLKELDAECDYLIEELTGTAVEHERVSAGDIAEDEMVIFIHLFNMQGKLIKSWRPLLTSKALVDHSVNRPIYAHQSYVDELIRSRENPEQHAYVRAVIKKTDLLMSEENSILKDKIGNPMIRIKHGALKPHNIKEFYHKGKIYVRSAQDEYGLQNPQPENDEASHS